MRNPESVNSINCVKALTSITDGDILPGNLFDVLKRIAVPVQKTCASAQSISKPVHRFCAHSEV